MVSRNDLQRVGEFVWEIPREFREDMRAPARLYADDELLEDALQDKSLEQLVNTAAMPGIVKYAIAMPDIHQGYGAPVGGVFATDAEDGVISPGAVGYDINCLSGESRILHHLGYTQTIADMEHSWHEGEIVCQDFAQSALDHTHIERLLKVVPHHGVFRLTTEAGDEIIATGDHPFWTPRGMVQLKELAVGAQVAMYPFEGVPYTPPTNKVLVSEKDVRKRLHELGIDGRGNADIQIMNHLLEHRLIPLRYDSLQLPHLIKLLGLCLGDGSIHFSSGRGHGVTWFFGQAPDLERVRQDVIASGFTPSVVYARERENHIETEYRTYEFISTEHSVKVADSAFAILLNLLGAAIGKKTTQDFEIPRWLQGATLWQQRLFLATFFGAELSAPKAFDRRNFNFYAPMLSLTKYHGYVESGKRFLKGIARLLRNFGVQTKALSEHIERANKEGIEAHRLRLILSSKPESLHALWGKVGYEYNAVHQQIAMAGVQYLKHKSSIISRRSQAMLRAHQMQEAGVARASIFETLLSPIVNVRFLERSLYEGRQTPPRVSSNFIKFDQYLNSVTAGLAESGMVWERIARIEVLEWNDYVYDFTVAHHDHNFVANGFVVSNCGVRVLASHLNVDEVKPHLQELASTLDRNCPSGVGSSGRVVLRGDELDDLLNRGGEWTVERGYARPEDLQRTEEFGRLNSADASQVSSKAKERARDQLGTLGAGNHFIEVDRIAAIYDEGAANALGLFTGQVVVQIHCGSRGLGHQVCQDYVNVFQKVARDYNLNLPDRELVAAPYTSDAGQEYAAAMAAAANFAFANRQVLAFHIRRSFAESLKGKVSDFDLDQVYDIAHNMAKLEEHQVGGGLRRVLVHRKGATRAFGPNSPVLPDDLKPIGQPVLIPGSMGTMSFILVGTAGSMEQTFGSSCHGAGRVWSRHKAKKEVRGEQLRAEMHARGIAVRAGSLSGLAEEAPQAYKDVSRVVEVVNQAGIGKKVARLEPMAVIKG